MWRGWGTRRRGSITKMRMVLAVFAVWLAGCGAAPAPARKAAVDPVAEGWYAPAVAQLAAMNQEAEGLLRAGKGDEAAKVIEQGQPVASRVLSAPHPTLAAMEAAGDLDTLYARMLLENKHYGWARLTFQKNVSRWKSWRPETAETARRLVAAREGIAECDRRMGQ